MAINQIANLGVKVDPRGAVTGASKAKRAITGIGNSARNVKNRIMSLQGALIGLGAGAVLKSIITTASEVESLQIRLKFLTGSTEDASKAFDTMNEFAKKVPFTLEEIERATPSLLTVAKDVDELNELLAITGDIAVVSGLSFQDTARQLQRSFSSGIASAEMFRDEGTSAFLGFEQGVSKTGKETKKIIMDMFRDGTTTAKGATAELARSFVGSTSMMQDAMRDLKLEIADAGVFEATAKAVIQITEELRKPETVKAMQQIGTGLTNLGVASGTIIKQFLDLPKPVQATGLVLALLGGTGGRLAVAGVIAFKDEIKEIATIFDAMGQMAGITPKTEEGLEMALALVNEELRLMKPQLKAIDGMWDWAKKPMGWWASATEGNPLTTLQAKFIKLTEEARLLQTELDKIRGVTNEEIIAVSNLKDEFRALEGLHTISLLEADEIVSIESYRAELDAMMQSYREVVIEATKLPPVIDAIGSHMDKNSIYAITMADKIKEINEAVADAKDKQEEFALGLEYTIENSIMKMTQGLMSFKDVVKSIFRQVASEMVKYNIARPLASAISGIVTNTFGGAITGTSGVDVPPRARGGNVNAGQPYMVGEKGAELFVPKSSGDIVPNNQIGGSTVINVTYSPQVNALDPRTAGTVIVENAPTIVGVVRQAFERNGQQVLI